MLHTSTRLHEVYAHEHWDKAGPSIFLAGPSPRKETDYNWRPQALDHLEERKFQGAVFIPLPRNGEWHAHYDSQVEWELEYLEKAKVIAFWIPREIEHLPAFTTNVEFGLYVKSGKIVLGYPEWAVKMRYLHFLAQKYKAPICNSLEDTMLMTITMC